MKSSLHHRTSMYDGTAPANWPTPTTMIFKLPHAQQQHPSLVSPLNASESRLEQRSEALWGKPEVTS